MKQERFITYNWMMTPNNYKDKNKEKQPTVEGKMLFTVNSRYLKSIIEKEKEKQSERLKKDKYITICPLVMQDEIHEKGKVGPVGSRLKYFKFKKPAETIFVNCWATKYWIDRIEKMPDDVNILVAGDYDASDYDNFDDNKGSFILRRTVFLLPNESMLLPEEESKDYKSENGFFVTSVSGRFLTAKDKNGKQNLHIVEMDTGEKFATATIKVLGEEYDGINKIKKDIDHKLSDYGYEDAKEKVYVSRNFSFDKKGNEKDLIEKNPDNFFAFLMRYDMSKDSKKGKGDYYGTKLPTQSDSMLMFKPSYQKQGK